MIQEAFLAGYFSLATPCRVLEFGCGFGRHLSYLRGIEGLDLHGCDPSQSMLAIARENLPADWFEERVKLISPGGRLPYPDKSFDVVFSASVLIHIHPEDVPAVISELLRVARGHILHIENPTTDRAAMTCGEHNGCWAHPLQQLYAERGVNLELLPAHGTLQAGYRASLDGAAMPDVAALAGRLCEMESHLTTASFHHAHHAQEARRAAQLDQQVAEQARALARQQHELRESEARGAGLRVELADLQKQLAESQANRIEQKATIEKLNDQIARTRRSLADALRRHAEQTAMESAFHERLQSALLK
jgi:SAM-dependent methyltransferase